MIDLYSWPTPNGKKITVALEVLGLAYRAHPVDIGKGEQFKPEFLRISPNNKIPALVDSDGPGGRPIELFESGAILCYLGGKTGRLMGNTDRDRWEVLQWIMFQMGGFGPMLGQAHHFRIYAPEQFPYAVRRYTEEAQRLYKVLEARLATTRQWVAANTFSMADIALYPWACSHDKQGVDLDNYPAVKAWMSRVGDWPGVQVGMEVMSQLRRPLTDATAKSVLFNIPGQQPPGKA